MIFLFVASLVSVSAVNVNDTNPSSELIKKIRRQLMEDNYDYLPTESEEFPLNNESVNQQRSVEKMVDEFDYHENDKERSNMTDTMVPRARDAPQGGGNEVSKNDLFYYLNDDRIGLKDDYDNKATGSKVKYKVMKVRSAHPNRRSFGVRRFIKEHGQDGVALMTLDDEPFPDFKLPKSRRQYMQETTDDEDVEDLMESISYQEH